MTIKVGDVVPEATLFRIVENAPTPYSTSDLFKGKRVVLFGLPGAFTPTCSANHLPGYVARADEFFSRGIDTIVCLSVNDAWVMRAWGEQQNAQQLVMAADGTGEFTRAMGLSIDLSVRGYGERSNRYAMLVDDGVVTHLNIEAPGKLEISDADSMLKLV